MWQLELRNTDVVTKARVSLSTKLFQCPYHFHVISNVGKMFLLFFDIWLSHTPSSCRNCANLHPSVTLPFTSPQDETFPSLDITSLFLTLGNFCLPTFLMKNKYISHWWLERHQSSIVFFHLCRTVTQRDEASSDGFSLKSEAQKLFL